MTAQPVQIEEIDGKLYLRTPLPDKIEAQVREGFFGTLKLEFWVSSTPKGKSVLMGGTWSEPGKNPAR